MSGKLKICRVGDFMRLTEVGVLDVDRSIRIVHKLVKSAQVYKEHNILLDLRDTELHASLGDLIIISLEFACHKAMFKKKIAILIPDNKERLQLAKQFKFCMEVHGFLLRHFTNYEDAIEWLSSSTIGIQSLTDSIRKAS